MNIKNSIRKLLENWILSDGSNKFGYTDTNKINVDFINDFGITNLCLIEMFDEENNFFYTPTRLGKIYSLKFNDVDANSLKEITEALNENLIEGACLKFIGFNLIKDEEPILYLIISLPNEDEGESEKNIEILYKAFLTIVNEIVDFEFSLNGSDVINLTNRLNNSFIYEKEGFNSIYDENYFIKEQLEPCNEVEAMPNFIRYDNKKCVSLLGVRQSPYFREEPSIDFLNHHLNLNQVNKISYDYVIFGIYKPKLNDSKKITLTEKFKNRLAVFHFIAVKEDENRIENEINNLQTIQKNIGYLVDVFKNKQLGVLSIALPFGVTEKSILSLENMKAVRRVDKVETYELLTLFSTLKKGQESGF